MKKWVVLLALLLFVVLLYPFWLPLPGKFLQVPDQLKPADIIVVLRGYPSFYRVQKGADLFKRRYGETILLSPVPQRETEFQDYYQFEFRLAGAEVLDSTEMARRSFIYFGIAPEALQFTGGEATSTFEEAEATLEWMKAAGRDSMILVTSTYHMRRAYVIFRLVFRGSGIEIYPVTARNPIYHPEAWWRYERDVKRVLEEYVSLAFNLLYHFVFGQRRTAFDHL